MIAGLLERAGAVYLPRSSGGRWLAVGVALSAVGSGAFMASSVLYFVDVLALPAASVGAALSLAAACGLVSPVPAAHLADRAGPARVYLVLLLVRAVGYALYTVIRDLPLLVLMICALTAVDRACSPLQQMLVARVAGDEHRTHTLAAVAAARNGGLSAGLLLSGVVLAAEPGAATFRALFLVNSASFLVMSLVVWQLSASLQDEPEVPLQRRPATSRTVLRDRRYLALSLSNAAVSLHDTILLVVLPIWVTQVLHGPPALVPALLAANTGLTLLVQVPAARYARGKRAAVRCVQLGVVSLVLACLAFGVGSSRTNITAAIFAVLLLTLGEILHTVGGWELSFLLAPDERQGQYLATYGLGLSLQEVVGPLLCTAVLLPLGTTGWGVLAFLFLLGGVGMTRSGTAVKAAEGTTT